MAEEKQVEEQKTEESQVNNKKRAKHEKVVYTYPDGTTLVYYSQDLNKCTDVTMGFRVPRVEIPKDDEIIGIYDDKLIFYQNFNDLIRVPLIKPGIIHFIEHMIYSSLESIPKEQIFDYLARTNTEYNAFTSQDTMAVEFSCPSKYNEQIFQLYSGLIFRDKYNENDLENEKKPVFQELQRKIDEPKSDIIPLLKKSNELTAEEILGCDEKIIQSFTEKQMLDFAKAYFTRENMIISVVSDRPFDEIKKLCDKHFVEKAPSNEATVVRTPEPSYHFNNDDLLLYPDTSAKTATISFILKGIPDYEKNEVYSSVENFILNNFHGRLLKALRNENGKVYTPFFVNDNEPGLPLKIFEAQTTPNNVKAVLDDMIKILTDLVDVGITDAEFEGFKEMWGNRRDRAVSVKFNESDRLYFKILHNLPPFVGQYNKKISELTKEDINKYLKETYAHARCCLCVSGNFDKSSLKPLEEILKFRPLNRFMEDKFKNKEEIDKFFKFLGDTTIPDDEYYGKLKYVKDGRFEKYQTYKDLIEKIEKNAKKQQKEEKAKNKKNQKGKNKKNKQKESKQEENGKENEKEGQEKTYQLTVI